MRYLFILLFCLLAPQLSMAQQHKSLEIDASSFAPVHTDALTGVAIDKIPLDHSKRPCARIKMHINRMTREDIAKLSVQPVGGNVVVMKRIVAAEGNGLIIELTAREQTRFYLHHDKYGDSNAVTLNLEGNKEYRLNAELSQLQSIVIGANVIGADVYVDDVYKGVTNEGFVLTVNDILHGPHKLRVEYGAARSEQQIEVTSTNIHFRLEVNTLSSVPQYVVFEVIPKEATVEIDGKSCPLDEGGAMTTTLYNGTYTYSISAKYYHSETGAFTVNGEKVERTIRLRPAHGWLKVGDTEELRGARVYVDEESIGKAPVKSDKLQSGKYKVRIVKELYKTYEGEVTISDGQTTEFAPTLEADFATVTLTTGEGFAIYVNNEYKGTTTWSGRLATGTYRFEARKSHHRSTLESKTISVEPSKQSYTIPTPEPILGAINITSDPAVADVYIDGKRIGRTPLLHRVIIGSHRVELRKEGYKTSYKSIEIKEGKTDSLNVSLTEKITPSYSSSYSSSDSSSYSTSTSQGDSSDSSSDGKYFKVTFSTSGCPVYVDGRYKGTTNSTTGFWLNYGSHYIVVKHNNRYYGKTIYLGSYSSYAVSMTGAPKVDSIYKSSSSSYSSSSSSSSYSKTKVKKSIEGFNVGLSTGLGYELYGGIEFNAGVLWRLWRYNSLFNAMTGVSYMRAWGCNYLNIPAVVNWNYLRDDALGMYFGLGTEFSLSFEEYNSNKTIYYDFPFVIQGGVGLRHWDVNLYVKCYINHEIYSVGCRIAYMF